MCIRDRLLIICIINNNFCGEFSATMTTVVRKINCRLYNRFIERINLQDNKYFKIIGKTDKSGEQVMVSNYTITSSFDTFVGHTPLETNLTNFRSQHTEQPWLYASICLHNGN